MKTQEEIRKYLDEKIAEKGTNYRELSLAIGRKDQYIHQYIKYGLPQKLKEDDRRAIARILQIDEQELSSKPLFSPIIPTYPSEINVIIEDVTKLVYNLHRHDKETIAIDILNTVACCGSGSDQTPDDVIGQWIMPADDYHNITFSSPKNIKMLQVKGDSMEPTLKDGDWVLVDISRISPDSDGLFLLRLSGGLAVKRIQCGFGEEITILSDNELYQPRNATIHNAAIIGKVIYTLKSEKVG